MLSLSVYKAAVAVAPGASTVPNPSPKPPPGSSDFLTVLNWVMWIALACGVLGFIIAGVMMMLQSQGRMSSGGEHMGRVAWVAVGCIVVAAASGLTNQFAG